MCEIMSQLGRETNQMSRVVRRLIYELL